MLTLNRPAQILSDADRLDAEYRSARWAHHRLIDFEAQHQRVLDETADAIAPGIVRIGRILARLSRRARRAERTTAGSWCPNPRAELAARLRTRLDEARKRRNADPRWKAALGWADEPIGEAVAVRRRKAKPPEKVKRRKTETDEAYAKRFELLTHDETDEHYAAKLAAQPRRSRRDQYRAELYGQRRIYWGTWNALVRSVDQARKDVMKLRKKGIAAEIGRPKFRDPVSLCTDDGGVRIVDRGTMTRVAEVVYPNGKNDCFPAAKLEGRNLPDGSTVRVVDRASPWWTIAIRIGTSDEWATVRAKCGTWHDLPDNAAPTTAKLTRRRDGERWSYSLSLTIEATKSGEFATSGVVAFDWGHREHGHDRWREGIRAFTWIGDDGRTGEILIPTKCRQALDEIDALKSRMDEAFNARQRSLSLPDRNRYVYRHRLMRSGVKTEEETAWLRWEMRYERRITKRRQLVQDVRRETYLAAVRDLRQHYAIFAFEGETGWSLRKAAKEEQTRRRTRSNRDLATRYEFLALCERFGAEIITVTARNSTRECPDCGVLLDKNGPELIVVCPGCGRARDKDHGARLVIMSRAKEALANRAA